MSETNVGTARFAQTFTAQHTGTLTSAQIAVLKMGSPGDWIVDILGVSGAGVPVDGPLASATVPDIAVADGSTDITATFATPANVIAGQQYALEFSRPASSTTGVGKRDSVGGSACAGQLFESGPAPGAFIDTGQTGADMVFSVTVNAPLLTVQKSGTGAGTVTGTGIDCGVDCTEAYATGSSVTLTAVASAGSLFSGWTGCDTPSANRCTISMTADRTVAATFTRDPLLTVAPTGQRAAALKKCKTKNSKKARRKCRGKANLLPL